MGRQIVVWASCAISFMYIILIGCGGGKIADRDMAIAAGKIVDSYSGELKDELYQAIADSGVVWAVRVCAEKGPELANQYSTIPGITVRRVSMKHRNTQNAPDEFETAGLATIEDRPANAGDIYFRWSDDNKTFRFMKAIRIKATCLNCHGDKSKFSDDLKAVLDEKYPNDMAVDFKLDDYRGAYSVLIDWPEGKAAVDSIMKSM